MPDPAAATTPAGSRAAEPDASAAGPDAPAAGGLVATPRRPEREQATAAGPARALAATYALFALAAGARSAVQLAVDPGRAPLAYALSAVAAALYLGGTVALRRPDLRAARVALAVCTVELLGVLVVGTWSLLDAAAFPDDTVWSRYGSGYGHVPLLLPVLGLVWLRRRVRRPA